MIHYYTFIENEKSGNVRNIQSVYSCSLLPLFKMLFLFYKLKYDSATKCVGVTCTYRNTVAFINHQLNYTTTGTQQANISSNLSHSLI